MQQWHDGVHDGPEVWMTLPSSFVSYNDQHDIFWIDYFRDDGAYIGVGIACFIVFVIILMIVCIYISKKSQRRRNRITTKCKFFMISKVTIVRFK